MRGGGAGAPIAGAGAPCADGSDAGQSAVHAGRREAPGRADMEGWPAGESADAPSEPTKPEPSDLQHGGVDGTVALRQAGSFGSALDRLRALAPARVSLNDLQVYQRACGHEGRFLPMLIEREYASLGVRVARSPVLTIALSLVVVLCLSAGLLFARYETEPEKLYVPQFSPLGMQRKYIDATFGARPQPGIFVVQDRELGGNIVTREHVRAIFDLHEAVSALSVPWHDGTAPGGRLSRLAFWRRSEVVPRELGFEELCARRYFNAVSDTHCLSSSILRLWLFSRESFEEDAEWEQTVVRAQEQSVIDLGQATWHAGPNGTRQLRGEALQLSYYFDSAIPEYANGGMAELELGLVQLIATVNAGGGPIRLSYWSTKLNEKDASSVATKDLDVLCMTFGFILVYVCVTLGGFTTDRRRSRMALGGFCGICTFCSLSSGFGICCYIGVPLAPMSTLVLFVLIGVSVDDMIIIVDAFDRTSAQVSLEERVRIALSHAGTAVTMTSATTMVAFLSGVNVDLPSIQLFCAPAAACVLMVNVLQVTLFTALLVLDARRQLAGELDCQRCLPSGLCVRGSARPGAVGAADGTNGGARTRADDGADGPAHMPEGEVGCTNSPLGRFWRHHYAEWLMQTRVRIAVVLVFALLLGVAAALIPHLEVGLPMESTLPADSVALAFFSDVNRLWTGTQDFQIMLVLRNTDLTSHAALDGIAAALAELAALPFILDIVTNWMDEYAAYANCTQLARTGLPLPAGRRPDFSALGEWLADGGVQFCRYDPELAAGADDGSADASVGGDVAGLRRLLREEIDGREDAGLEGADADSGLAGRARPRPLGDGASATRGGGSVAEGGALGRWRLHEAATQAAAQRAEALRGVSRAIEVAGAAEAAAAADGVRTAGPARPSLLPSPLAFWYGAAHPPTVATLAQPAGRSSAGRQRRARAPSRAPAAATASAETAQSLRPGKPCVDANRQFARLSHGYLCRNATDHCAQGQRGWRIVNQYCPLSCGRCVPSTAALGVADGGSGGEGGGEEEEEDFEVVDGGLGASSDVRLDPTDPTRLLASRFVLTSRMTAVLTAVVPQYEQINAVLKRHAIDGYVYHYRYEFGVCDQGMPRLCVRNLLVAALGIFLSVLLFLPLRLALLSTATVVMIDVLLLGVMALYRVRLHCMTTVTLLIALGLAIDYSCHLAHAYETSPLPTQLDKVKHACSTMGLSILNAGASTLLGTGFMAFSETPVFQTVFILVWNTVLFGLCAGLMLVPVVLSVCGGGVHKSNAIKLLHIIEDGATTASKGGRSHSSHVSDAAGPASSEPFVRRQSIPMA